jgi:hypothetical protein
MAVVAGVLLDHVDIDPAEGDVLPPEGAGVGQSQLSSVVRSSAFKGGSGRSMVLTGRLSPAAEAVVMRTGVAHR